MGPGAGEVSRIRRERHEWEQQFLPTPIPPGTPNRKALHKQAVAEALSRSNRPENVAKRTEFERRLREAQKVASGATDVIDTVGQLQAERKRVIRCLLDWGFSVVRNHGGSAYLTRCGFTVRVSDHEIPETDERRGRRSWCRSPWQLIVTDGTRRSRVDKWLASVALEAGKKGGVEAA